MKQFFRLYVTELRRNRLFALFVFVAHFSLLQFFSYTVYFSQVQAVRQNQLMLILFMVLITTLPLTLYYSFISAQTYGSSHLLFSLPVPRPLHFAARYCALVSMAVPVVLAYGLMIILPQDTFRGFMPLMLPPPRFIEYYFDALSRFGSMLIFLFLAPFALLAGLVCAVESVTAVVKRYTAVVRFVFLIGSLIGVLWSMVVLASYAFALPDFPFHERAVIEELMFQYESIISAYAAIIGLLFLLAGMLVYDRFADV